MCSGNKEEYYVAYKNHKIKLHPWVGKNIHGLLWIITACLFFLAAIMILIWV